MRSALAPPVSVRFLNRMKSARSAIGRPMIERKIVDGSGSHHAAWASTEPEPTKPSINSLASWRTRWANGATCLAVKMGSINRRYLRWISPSRPSGMAGRSLPRYFEPCSTAGWRVTNWISAMVFNDQYRPASSSCRTAPWRWRSAYIWCGHALACGPASAGSPHASPMIVIICMMFSCIAFCVSDIATPGSSLPCPVQGSRQQDTLLGVPG